MLVAEDVFKRPYSRESIKEIQMKKLMTVLLGLSFVIGTATVTFAQDKKEETKKETKKKTKKAKKEEKK